MRTFKHSQSGVLHVSWRLLKSERNGMDETLVLVTGGTGFIAQHCMLALLNSGYRLRTTVRSLEREAEVRQQLRNGGVEAGKRLSFVAADLGADQGWADAVAGCRFVLHGASPTPSGDQVREQDWVQPAVDGNLRVLRAARDAGVRRVVLTSAFGAVGMGHGRRERTFNESDWSNLNGNIAPYQKSKTLAERAAWSFIEAEGGGMELAAINPTAVLGPALGADYSHSIRLIKNMLDGQPGCPRINSCFVDVRDVADLHLLAMVHPAASGQRFLATSGDSAWLVDVARLLRQRLGHAADKVSTRVIPDWFIRLGALRNPAMKSIRSMLGVNMNASNEKARRLLGWTPRTRDEAILACAESLIKLGLLATSAPPPAGR
jgi:dihydroflavonol-4-reductase